MRLFKVMLILILSVFYNCKSKNDKLEINPIGGSLTVKNITNLSSIVSETSGLINFNGRIITQNDSGGKPDLYEIDVKTGDIKRVVTVKNAVNVDMEELAQDKNFIYLCDIGNNSNNRKDQTIYKINKEDYLNNNEVVAQKIKFQYAEQKDFSKTNRTTNFDAEAVVNIGNELFLFTKNWGDNKTSVYKVPKEKGIYNLTKIGNYDINGLITAAAYNENTKTIMLTGYSNFIPFIVKLTNFSQNNPLDGKVDKKSISVNGSKQVEAISSNADGSFYLSAEKTKGFSAVLYKMTY